MIVDNINKTTAPIRILVAPLDWGLGHATRCIPIINALKEHNIEVIIATEGPVELLLQNEYPGIVILPLKGYKIKYSRHKVFFFMKMLAQIPAVIASIYAEKRWLKKAVDRYKIDAVISDNRFGLCLNNTPCVYVTHQLFIQTGNRLLNIIAQRIHYSFINKFDECWVPDSNGVQNLAGELSHPPVFPKTPVKYLGTLSRFNIIKTELKYDLLILLSGPEPQRSIFEDMLMYQLKNYKGTAVLVRGLPVAGISLYSENDHLIIHDHLPANKLNELIQQSENIIARCGYSTVMDLVTLKHKAILVPTPGQTEQEYLAAYLMEKKLFYTCSQEGFLVQQALDKSNGTEFKIPAGIKGIQKEVIISWVRGLGKQINAQQ